MIVNLSSDRLDCSKWLKRILDMGCRNGAYATKMWVIPLKTLLKLNNIIIYLIYTT